MGFLDIFKIGEYKDEIKRLSDENARLDGKLREIGADDYDAVQALVRSLQSNVETLKKEQEEAVVAYEKSKERINALEDKESKLNKSITTQTNKLSRSKELVKAILYTIENFYESDPMGEHLRISSGDMEEIEELSPSVILKLHSMDMKDLRSAYRQNDRQITQVMTQYESRYTTKANKAIYKLMVIALRAELQNILVSLKYDKLDNAIEKVKAVTQKYLSIAASGNQSIAGTLTKFIGEIEYLFINAVKIEYNYYVKKEQARQEQLAIREQIRQEAEERRALEQERKKVAAEESKYTAEIEKLKGQLSSAHEEEEEVIKGRILQLQSQLSEVVLKKEEISKLANGKAGNVYIISNLGSFGEDVFKVGMTRRLNPQDRIDELGNASVPFRFDVHSFIFSDDAVSLETRLHQELNDKRVNKVNLRKEFFRLNIDELEKLVTTIDPTAEFNKTMMATEFYQSESSSENYTTDYDMPDEDDDEPPTNEDEE